MVDLEREIERHSGAPLGSPEASALAMLLVARELRRAADVLVGLLGQSGEASRPERRRTRVETSPQ